MAGGSVMHWLLSDRADPLALPIADRHYNRQKPGTPQYVPPGRCICLRSLDGGALWVTSWPFAEFVKHDWPGLWVNTLFRRESGPLASDLIRDAVAATRAFWDPPEGGIVTFVDASKIKKKRDPGRCYRKAGFREVGKTRGGLIALQMLRSEMPPAERPFGYGGQQFIEVA